MIPYKILVISLSVIAITGTLGSWFLKMHDQSLSEMEKHSKIRLQQVLDECTRRVDQQKAQYEQVWSSKMKEMQLKIEKASEKTTDIKPTAKVLDDNKKLQAENENLLHQLEALKKEFEDYKKGVSRTKEPLVVHVQTLEKKENLNNKKEQK